MLTGLYFLQHWSPVRQESRLIHPASQDWAEQVFSQEEWSPAQDLTPTPGEAGGFFVRNSSGTTTAWLKPTAVCVEQHPRAANEKIVADIAHELDLPVSPVLLYRRSDAPPGYEQRTCLSLVTHARAWRWGSVIGANLDGPILALVCSVLAKDCGIIALDTWIGQTDRNNEGNALIVLNPDRPADARFTFLDSANALGHGDIWNDLSRRELALPSFPTLLTSSVDVHVLRRTIKAIEDLPAHRIETIVRRIPEDYMTSDRQAIVVATLNERKGKLREFLAATFQIQ
jgi:hypothetical protein